MATRPLLRPLLPRRCCWPRAAVRAVQTRAPKEPKSRFVELLHIDILNRGPLAVSTFMQEALTNPLHGYYTTRPEVLGETGDFVTSPELSQMFGELVGLWCVSMWQKLGRPAELHLVELGPGTGLLMADVLRSARHFPDFGRAAKVTLVELPSPLREKQRTNITAVAPDVSLSWVDNLDQLNATAPVLILAHEFFDAMPVHRFQKTERGWCEIFVEMDTSAASEYHFRFVAHPRPTIRNVLTVDQRLAAAKEGDYFEVSPKSLLVAEHMINLLRANKGAALIIDYGVAEGWVKDSLRGFRRHQQVSPLSRVGETDLTVDVDFPGIQRFVLTGSATTSILPTSIMTQREFLTGLGVDVRLLKLLERCGEAEGTRLARGYQRLLDPKGMGHQYKCMALYHSTIGLPPPWVA